MALIAQYDESDAYWDEDDVANAMADDPDLEAEEGYQEDLDQMYYDDFKYEVREAFSKRKFPLVLVARRSNWRGQDGYAKCDDVDDVLQKVGSFESGSMSLNRGVGGSLWFSMSGTHDVPTGFTIEVKPYNAAYWNDDA